MIIAAFYRQSISYVDLAKSNFFAGMGYVNFFS